MIYLDNAATSWPKPQRVIDAMSRSLREGVGSPNRGTYRQSLAAGRVVDEARMRLARLVHAPDPSRIIHCLNCTDALNIAIKGVLREGDHVITTVLEHNSVSRPLAAMEQAGRITLSRLPMTARGTIDPDAVRAAVNRKTRLIAMIHASNVTGAVQPVGDVGRISRDHDLLFLLDAAQTMGLLAIDVEAMNVDLLAFPGHKSLLGPTGTGGLYVGSRANPMPWREGGTGGHSASAVQPEEYPTRLEVGTPNMVGIAGLNAALDGLDPAAAWAHERRLVARLCDQIGVVPGVHVVGDWRPEDCVGVLSLVFDDVAPEDAAAVLDQSSGICVRAGLQCAPYIHRALGTFPDGTVRLSPGPTTTDEEIDRAAAAIAEIASTPLI